MIRKIIMEVSPILLILIAVLLGVIAIPIGVLYTLSKPFYDHKSKPFKKRMIYFFTWILRILYQVWVVIRYSMFQVAYILDILSNVLVGELIEDIITHKENTMLGNGDISISAAIGDIKKDKKALNGRGLLLDKILSKIDQTHEDHCGASIKLWEFKRDLRKGAYK
jgi:hypothetical protein